MDVNQAHSLMMKYFIIGIVMTVIVYQNYDFSNWQSQERLNQFFIFAFIISFIIASLMVDFKSRWYSVYLCQLVPTITASISYWPLDPSFYYQLLALKKLPFSVRSSFSSWMPLFVHPGDHDQSLILSNHVPGQWPWRHCNITLIIESPVKALVNIFA